jgi:hypothetical protein
MDVVIQVDAPRLLPLLTNRLRAAGFFVLPVSSHASRIVDSRAEDAAEALCELRFFASAWARAHGDVAVDIRPAS